MYSLRSLSMRRLVDLLSGPLSDPWRALLGCLLACLLVAPVCADEESPDFRRQFVDGPFGQIHVLSSAPRTDQALQTPMICFAPNPASGNYFRLFMTELGRDRVMIAPDYPGLGDSDPPPGFITMEQYADAMAAVLDALGYGAEGKGSVDVCGYHTGTFVAIELAIQRPDLVRRLVLAGIPFYTGAERDAEYQENVKLKPVTEELSSLQDSWDFAVTDRQAGVTLERGFANFIDVLQAVPRRHYAYHAVFTYPAEVRAPMVVQPVLILNTHGGLKDQTRAIAPLLGKATLVEVPELHHGVWDVGAERLAELARPFLDAEVSIMGVIVD